MSSTVTATQQINYFIRKVLADFPIPAEIAAHWVRDRIKEYWNEELDPDTTLLVTLEYNIDNPHTAFNAVIVQSMTLTEAMLSSAPPAPQGMINTTGFSTIAPFFKVVNELPRLLDNRIPAQFNEEWMVAGWIPPRRYEALYLESAPQAYDARTQLSIPPAEFRSRVYSNSFEQTYDTALNQFWDKHLKHYKTLMRAAFIKGYLHQFNEFSLTQAERNIAARAAGVVTDKTLDSLTLGDLQATYTPDKNLSLRLLRIYKSEATDILTITDNPSGITLLYIPGNSSPFHGFNNAASMKTWLVNLAKDAPRRQSLASHFEPDALDSGLIYSGVEEALVGMAVYPKSAPTPGFFNQLMHNGYWDPEPTINNDTYGCLSGNPFDYMTRQIKARIAKLSANSTRSPLDVHKSDAINILEKACLLALPISLTMGTAFIAEFCFVTLGAVEMTLGVDDLFKGKAGATERIVFGALNAAPVVIYGMGSDVTRLAAVRPKLGPAAREADGKISASVTPSSSAKASSGTDEGRPLKEPARSHGLQSLSISGQPFLSYKAPNEWGFFELFVSDPASPGKVQSTGLYAIQSTDLKWRHAGLKGGGAFRNAWQRIYQRLGGNANATFYSKYEMPLPTRDTLSDMLKTSSSFSEDFEPMGSGQQALKDSRQQFFEKRKQLNSDSATFFDTLAFTPLRPVLPSFELNDSQPVIIQKIFAVSEGLVVGESHAALSSKAFLINNMDELAKQGVKRIYFEHLLTDVHKWLLKTFYRSKTAQMPEELRLYLKSIFPPQGNALYSFYNVVVKAREAGLKIQPIDCTASYKLNGMVDTSGTLRQRMMNFYAAEVIQWVQNTKRRPGKWIALVGDSHCNTFQGIPGIAELTGSIGLRVEDAAAGREVGIFSDPGRTSSQGIGKGDATVKANFVLRVNTHDLQQPLEPQPGPSHSRVLQTPQLLLTRPGQFLLTPAPAGIHYRSRRGDLRTFVVNTVGGQFSISATGWDLDGQLFDSVQALVDALKVRPGLEQVLD